MLGLSTVHAGGLDIRWHSLAGATFKGSIGQSTQEQRLQKLSHDVGRGQGDSQKRTLYANVGKDESWWRSGRRGECLEEGGGLEYRVALSHAPSSPPLPLLTCFTTKISPKIRDAHCSIWQYISCKNFCLCICQKNKNNSSSITAIQNDMHIWEKGPGQTLPSVTIYQPTCAI